MYKLFLDDERFPIENDYIIIRSYTEAIYYMNKNGCPYYISFDHDLGMDGTGFDVVKWMVERDLDMNGNFIPINFKFYVHSMNPIGSKNIKEYLSSYLKNRLT